MIDWNMGRTRESLNSGRKTAVLTATLPQMPALPVTADRAGVGQPSREAVFQSVVGTALSSLVAIDAETRRLARAFRGSEIAAAHRDFAVLVETIRSLTILTAGLGHEAGDGSTEDPMAAFCASPSVCGMLSGIANAVEALIDAHRAGDWHGLADCLELTLSPALAPWRGVIADLGARRVA